MRINLKSNINTWRVNGWTLIDIEGVDIGSYVKRANQEVTDKLILPAGYSLKWSGQYEYMQRAAAKLKIVIPLTLTIIALLLFLNFDRLSEVLMLMGSLPFALIGSFWLMYW